MRRLLGRLAPKKPLSAADKKLLEPAERHLAAYENGLILTGAAFGFLAVLVYVASQMPGVSIKPPWYAVLFVISGVFGLVGWFKRYPTVDRTDIKDGRLPQELEHVARVFESLRLTYALRLVYESGPTARLLPRVDGKQLIVTKRFWTELASEEQRCAVALVARRGTRFEQLAVGALVFFILSKALLIAFALLAVSIRWRPDGMALYLMACVAYAAALAIFVGLYSWSSLIEWKRAARRAKAPDAPATILRKLLEEAHWPIERIHYRWLLRAFERRMPNAKPAVLASEAEPVESQVEVEAR